MICLEVESSISRWLSLSYMYLFKYLTTTTKISDGWETRNWRMVRARRGTHTPCGEFDDQDTKMVMIIMIIMMIQVRGAGHMVPMMMMMMMMMVLIIIIIIIIQVRGAGHMVPISKPKVARGFFQAFLNHPTWSCP